MTCSLVNPFSDKYISNFIFCLFGLHSLLPQRTQALTGQSCAGKKPITALPGTPTSLLHQSCPTVPSPASGELPLAGSMLKIPNTNFSSDIPHNLCIPQILAYDVFSESKEKMKATRVRAILHLLIYLKYTSSWLVSDSLEAEGTFFLLKVKPLPCVLNPISINFLLFLHPLFTNTFKFF